jgi:hypothetical protein
MPETLHIDRDQHEALSYALWAIHGRPKGLKAARDALKSDSSYPATLLEPLAHHLRAVLIAWQTSPASYDKQRRQERAERLESILETAGQAENTGSDRLTAIMRDTLSRAFAERAGGRIKAAAEPIQADLRTAVWAEAWADCEAQPLDMAVLAKWRLTGKPQSAHVAFRDPATGRYEHTLRVEPLKPDIDVPSNLTNLHIWVGGKPDWRSADGPEHRLARDPERLQRLLDSLLAKQAEHRAACEEFNATLHSSGTLGKLLERRPDAADLLATAKAA